MKTLFLFLFLTFLTVSINAQSKGTMTFNAAQNKFKTLERTGTILTAVGGVALFTGNYLYWKEYHDRNNENPKPNVNTYGSIMIGGIGLIAVGIPLLAFGKTKLRHIEIEARVVQFKGLASANGVGFKVRFQIDDLITELMNIKEVSRFSIRTYNGVLKLLPQLNPDASPLTEIHFKEILKSKGTHLFVAELENKEIAGMLTIGTYAIPTGTKAWIEDVVVDESQRGKGIGRELTLFAINFAKSKGYKSIELTSRPSRIAANKLYRNMGFVLRETNVYRYNFK